MHRSTTHVLSIIASLLLLAAPPGARAQCQQWKDGPLTAPNPSANGQVLAMTVWDTDGAGPAEPSLVIGGTFTQVGGVSANRVAIWNGWHWSALGTGCNNTVHALGVFNGQLFAGGDFTTAGGTSANRIARWTGTGWLPLGTGTNGGNPWGRVSALTVFDGGLIVGGSFTSVGGGAANCIARWSGSFWTALGAGMALAGNSPRVQCLAVFNSQLYAGGLFDHAGTVTANNIARWNGSTWNDLGPAFGGDGTDGQVRCMLVHNSALYVGGSFTEVPVLGGTLSAAGIARWTGSAWQSLDGGIPGSTIGAMAEESNGVLVGGFFPGTFNSIALWDDISDAWEPLDEGGLASGSVQSMVLYDHHYSGNGDIIVGGAFVGAGGLAVSNIVRVSDFILEYQPLAAPMVPAAIATLGSWLVVAGSGSQPTPTGIAENIMVWDGLELAPLGGGPNGWLQTMATKPGAPGTMELVVGGFFSAVGVSPPVAANNIAKWSDAGGWSAMGNGFNDVVWAVERLPANQFFGEAIVAGGKFTAAASGSPAFNRVALWDVASASWFSLGTGFNDDVLALTAYTSGPVARQIVAGGDFTTASGVSANHIARWDAPNLNGWVAMGSGFNGAVIGIERHNGSTYAAGNFTASGATPISHVARWTGTAWEQVGAGLPSNTWGLHSSGGILYANIFAPVGQSGLMKWDGASWSQVAGGANNDPIHSVFAIGTYHDELHISGYLSSTATAQVRLTDWTRYLTTGAPWIASQPVSQFPACGLAPTFTIQPAAGYSGLSYSWRRNGTPLSNGVTSHGTTISGATTNQLKLINVSGADDGAYDCVLSNTCGSETSAPAMLTVDTTCCADANHSGAVNIDDLLQVINNWGATGNSADVTHDGVVDIDDMLAVINGWGACP